MNFKEVDNARDSAETNLGREGFSTLEANAIKKVIRESWESKLKERGTNLDILNSHAAFMAQEMSAIDYESLCMQLIAARAKHMSRGELLTYTKMIEALALGYRSRFGADFSSLLIAGVALVSKDVKGVRRHFDYFLGHLTANAGTYEKRIAWEMAKVGGLGTQLKARNSGFLRFFRKREIAMLKSGIRAREAKIKRLQGRKRKYIAIAQELKTKANPSLPKGPGPTLPGPKA